jgi:hypothetical protein
MKISLGGLAVATHLSVPSDPPVVGVVEIERRHLSWQRGAGVAATTITRLARTDRKAAAAAQSLDLASKIVTVFDYGIEDLIEIGPANMIRLFLNGPNAVKQSLRGAGFAGQINQDLR